MLFSSILIPQQTHTGYSFSCFGSAPASKSSRSEATEFLILQPVNAPVSPSFSTLLALGGGVGGGNGRLGGPGGRDNGGGGVGGAYGNVGGPGGSVDGGGGIGGENVGGPGGSDNGDGGVRGACGNTGGPGGSVDGGGGVGGSGGGV